MTNQTQEHSMPATPPITKQLRGGASVTIADNTIYVRKHHSRIEAGFIVRELGPSEAIGNIARTHGGWRVMAYCHGYPELFETAAAAVPYALSRFA
jgi:hypothetical protein